MEPTEPRYSLIAIVLHWVMVLLIFTQFGLGWYMVDLPEGPDKSWYFALHKSIGLTVAMLALLRLIWRLTHRPPPLPDALPLWQQKLAHANHSLLYVFMFLQPVSGYISSSFSGYETSYFGIPLPHWGWKDQVLNELFTDVHVASSVVLVCLILLHIIGALSHVSLPQANVLRRMWP